MLFAESASNKPRWKSREHWLQYAILKSAYKNGKAYLWKLGLDFWMGLLVDFGSLKTSNDSFVYVQASMIEMKITKKT